MVGVTRATMPAHRIVLATFLCHEDRGFNIIVTIVFAITSLFRVWVLD